MIEIKLTKYKILDDFIYKLKDKIKEGEVKIFTLKNKENILNFWYFNKERNLIKKSFNIRSEEWKNGFNNYFKTYKDKKIFNFDYCDTTNLAYFFEKELSIFIVINCKLFVEK